MTILDKLKSREIPCSVTSTVIAFSEVGHETHYESVSWLSYLIDDSTMKYDSAGKVYKNLYHWTKVRRDMSVESVPVVTNGIVHIGSQFAGAIPCDYVTSLLTPLPVVLESDLDIGPEDPSADFRTRAKRLKFVSTDSSFSVVNFVIELAELKHFFKNSKKLLKRLVKFGKLGQYKTLGDILSHIVLEFSYGIGAFIRDITTAYNLCAKLSVHYVAFMSNMGKFTSARNLVVEDLPLPTDIYYEVDVCNYRFEVKVYHLRDKPAYTCVCVVYRYWSVVMTQAYGKMKYLLTQLGAELNPAIAWNAIPFSFVLDWFYPIGAFLDKYKIPLIDMSITLDSGGYGTFNQIRRITQVRQKVLDGYPELAYYDVIDETVSLYKRKELPLKEVAFGSLEFQGCTLRKARNATALIWARKVRG